ncbi:MAG TPA: ribosome biogenesis factor YjgA [Steroidobacteraceae bacterium]|nr:ribosome biogenesis factor YjgA [Steroidobacteraceae bacterium]
MGDTDDDEERPSRSERKRQSRDLQDLGWDLVGLPEAELAAMPLPDDVRDAVETARRITSNGALARQRLYIGKLLRRIDVEPIQEALERRGELDRQRIRREKALEEWRDRLLADEAAAWTELATRIAPDVLQQMRVLVRQARAEQSAARPPAAARQLFRRLRAALQAPDH